MKHYLVWAAYEPNNQVEIKSFYPEDALELFLEWEENDGAFNDRYPQGDNFYVRELGTDTLIQFSVVTDYTPRFVISEIVE